MNINELKEQVPTEAEAAALAMLCHKGVRYVYRDGVYYPEKGPATSIDCRQKPT